MRGIGCLLTGIELFPGNIQGGSDTPAGWAKGLSIDQEIKNHLQSRPGHAHPVRLARVRRDGAGPRRHLDAHGLRRAEQADRADRRSLPDVRQALRPHEGPGEPQEHPRRRCRTTCKKVGSVGQRGGPAAAGRARDLRPRDGAGAARTTAGPGRRPRGPRARAGREAGERQHPQDQQDADRPDGQQLRRRLRPRGDAAIHQLGRRGPDALARRRRGPPRALAQARTATRSRRRS